MTASIKNNGGSQFDYTIDGVVVGTFDNTGFTGVKNASITSEKLQDQGVTQAKLAAAVVPLGVGQTRQVLTASRALDTTYTNSTGRPIWVHVSVLNLGSTGGFGLQVTVGGVLYDSQIINGIGTGNLVAWLGLLVLPGETYSAGANGSTLRNWTEIR